MAHPTETEMYDIVMGQDGSVEGLRIRSSVAAKYGPRIFGPGGEVIGRTTSPDGFFALFALQAVSRALDVASVHYPKIESDVLFLIGQRLGEVLLPKFVRGLVEIGTSFSDRRDIACSEGMTLSLLEDQHERAKFCSVWVGDACYDGRYLEGATFASDFGVPGAAKVIVKSLMLRFPVSVSDELVVNGTEEESYATSRTLLERYSRKGWDVKKNRGETEFYTCPYATADGVVGFLERTNTCSHVGRMGQEALEQHLVNFHPDFEQEYGGKCRYCPYDFVTGTTPLSAFWARLQHATECAKQRTQTWLGPTSQITIPEWVSEARASYQLPSDDSLFFTSGLRYLLNDFHEVGWQGCNLGDTLTSTAHPGYLFIAVVRPQV